MLICVQRIVSMVATTQKEHVLDIPWLPLEVQVVEMVEQVLHSQRDADVLLWEMRDFFQIDLFDGSRSRSSCLEEMKINTLLRRTSSSTNSNFDLRFDFGLHFINFE